MFSLKKGFSNCKSKSNVASNTCGCPCPHTNPLNKSIVKTKIHREKEDKHLPPSYNGTPRAITTMAISWALDIIWVKLSSNNPNEGIS